MHHFRAYVCAHTCRHTPFISLDRNTAIRNISFFTASVAALWILILRRQGGKWEGTGYPFSLFILTRRGGESCSQLFSPEQGFGGTRTVHTISSLHRAGYVMPVLGTGPRRGRFGPPALSLSRLISHYSQLCNTITAQICSSKP